MSLTQRQRERAVEMFDAGELTTAQIATRIRADKGSISALRANYSRGNNVLGDAASTSTRKTRKSSSKVKATRARSKSTSGTIAVHLHSRKLTSAVRSGQPVELVLSL